MITNVNKQKIILICLFVARPMSKKDERSWTPSTFTEWPLSRVHSVVVDLIWTICESSSSSSNLSPFANCWNKSTTLVHRYVTRLWLHPVRTLESDQLCQDHERYSCLVEAVSASGHPTVALRGRTVVGVLALQTTAKLLKLLPKVFFHPVAQAVLEPTPGRLRQQ